MDDQINQIVSALIDSRKNYIVIYPNNDLGTEIILKGINELNGNRKFSIFPSVRFHSFLTILKNAEFIIGNSTIVREYCTLNRGTKDKGKSEVGNHCLLMAYVHVAHDCKIGDNSILANGVQLGGHVEIGEHVTIGGMTPVHQFCKIGDYAFIGGGLRIVQDVPPYILAMGEPLKFSGLNTVGLRRKNFPLAMRQKIKQAYKIIYQSLYYIIYIIIYLDLYKENQHLQNL